MEKYIEQLNKLKQEESHNKDITKKIIDLMDNLSIRKNYEDITKIENEINNIKQLIKDDEINQLIREIKKYITDKDKLEIIQTLDYDDLLHYSLLLQENNFEDAEEFLDSI